MKNRFRRIPMTGPAKSIFRTMPTLLFKYLLILHCEKDK